jgi:DNA-binding beta-propeller fold protein YncE
VALALALVVLSLLLRPSAATPEGWTVPVGRSPLALALAARSGRVIVASSADQTVRLLDATTGATLATTTVGHTPGPSPWTRRTAGCSRSMTV